MATDLYKEHFGLKERPFTLAPDPDFLFWSKGHGRAFAVLEYGLETHAPLTVVTGEVGTGKTTLIQNLLRNLRHDVTLGLISNAQGDRGDLLRWVLNALDVELPEDRDYVSLFQHFQNFVIDEYAAGRHVVLIIDEAQNLGPEMLEELRMFTNINSGKDEVLQLILAGQPELRDLITQPSMRQFAQRVTATFHLKPFSTEDTEAYISHRLKIAGGTGNEISEGAVKAIHNQARGIPRLINKLADMALVYAAAANQAIVTPDTIKEVLEDGLMLEAPPAPFYLVNRVDNRSGDDSSGEAAE